MSELDKLIENYFAPRSKTITKQILYEVFDEMWEEADMDPEKNLLAAIEAIESEGYEYELNKNVIKVKHDNRLEALDTLLKNLEPFGFAHNEDFHGSSLGRIEIKDRAFGNVFILIKPKRKTAALVGIEEEEKLAASINEKYADVGITATSAGVGHGSDLVIRGPQQTLKIEIKTSLGADFGQFRVQYDLRDQQWEPRRTVGFVKNKNIFLPLYEEYLADFLNQKCIFPNLNDPRLNKDKNDKVTGLKGTRQTGTAKRELQSMWCQGKTDYRKDFDFKLIAPYYANKGDELIQLGRKGLYALTDEMAAEFNIPKFEDSGLVAQVRFRLKPTMGANSPTSFTVAVKVKGKIDTSPLSLKNEKDLDKIINKLL